ncbi:MAG: phosphotransferase [Gammaproteobacteria bacterium]|nr:phosphotransferase [Gammaproteobacteria bacterium]
MLSLRLCGCGRAAGPSAQSGSAAITGKIGVRSHIRRGAANRVHSNNPLCRLVQPSGGRVSGDRRRLLEQWLDLVRPEWVGPLESASSDASFRRYWRFAYQDWTLIAVDAPPEREDSARFARLTRAFRQVGINSPEVIAEDHRRGFLVLSDLGRITYLQRLTTTTADALYGDAIDALIKLQVGLSGADLPLYDERLLWRELSLFVDWLLEALLELELAAPEKAQVKAAFGQLVEHALEQPQVAIHRDYHSRNLMLSELANPGVLDLQDAVLGPLTYDPVSLLKDCYIAWPRKRVLRWLARYAERARAARLPVPADWGQLVRWFDLMGAQRHLKAAGIFARLAVRDGRHGYLADLPRTLGYVEELGGLYPELKPLVGLISERVRPRLDQLNRDR